MPLIADRPKSLLEIRGKTILQRQIETLHAARIRNIAIVRGYMKEKIAPLPDVRFFDNDRHAETNTLASLFCAEEVLRGRVVALYGDILFDDSILEKLLKSEADITLVVDHAKDTSPAASGNGDRNGAKSVSHPRLFAKLRPRTFSQPDHVSA
ncbi:MAG: NTP transferase domain-containing protein [Acidobacteriota bacterium]|nr:NTP transferase domain-containing protein [Acidobacteriota bacterium]